MASFPGLYVTENEDYTVIRLPNLSNQEGILEIEQAITESLDNYATMIAINLSEFPNIYSMLITLLIHIRKKVDAAGGKICLFNVSINGQTQLRSMNMDKVFPMVEAEKDVKILL